MLQRAVANIALVQEQVLQTIVGATHRRVDYETLDLNFAIGRSEIFAVMGPSGCGKTTLMRTAVGLLRPIAGRICYEEESFWDADPDRQKILMQSFGVMYQGGALWTSMSLIENVSLPLMEFLKLRKEQAHEIASLKLALVGLAGFEDYYPAEISGGMRKRASIARASASPSRSTNREPSSCTARSIATWTA